jgi:2,4-dienoyl-CoA reductase-like NADH-dependent reductase (Old Yellow Enzyme family)
MTEATAVTPIGRITPGDLGIWSDAHIAALRPITAFIESQGSIPGMQLAHAGRKAGRTLPWEGNQPLPVESWGRVPAPSPLPFQSGWQTPAEMDAAAIEQLADDFAAATRRAFEAGFKVVEAHFAHGYLLHEFLSPLTNKRSDQFGGSLENRARAPLMVIKAMRDAWPGELPLFARLSVVDWAAGGLDIHQTICIARWLKEAGVDLVDCSSGAAVPDEKVPVAPGYHAGLAHAIREQAGVSTGLVGLIVEPHAAQEFIENGSADLIFLARAMLKDPYWARYAADVLQAENPVAVPLQYRRALTQVAPRTGW